MGRKNVGVCAMAPSTLLVLLLMLLLFFFRVPVNQKQGMPLFLPLLLYHLFFFFFFFSVAGAAAGVPALLFLLVHYKQGMPLPLHQKQFF